MARVSPPWIAPQPHPSYTKVIERQSAGDYTDQQFLPRQTYGRSQRMREYNELEGSWGDLWPGQERRMSLPQFHRSPPRMPEYFQNKPQPMFSKSPPPKPRPNCIPNPDPTKYYDPAKPVSHDRHFPRGSVITDQFFSNGDGVFISENGKANANLYYRTTRPLGARLRSHIVSKTTVPGYRFDCYRAKVDYGS